MGKALEQQAPAPLHRRHLQRPVDAADLAAEQRGRGHLLLTQVMPAKGRRQGRTAQRVAQPVRHLAALLTNKGGNRRQVVARIVADPVVLVLLITRRQAVPAHLGDPHIKTAARQVRPQANGPGRIPEPPIGKTAVQENHRHATRPLMTGQS